MKKKVHAFLTSALTAAAVAIATQAHGQSYLVNEGFEGEVFPPAGWKVIDADGDGHCWQIAKRGMATLNGSQIAISYTVNPENASAYGPQDNYLVLPAITVTNDSYTLAYKCCAEDQDTPESYSVLVSETGSDAADFKKELHAEKLENGYDDVELQSRNVSLADYVGKTVYIAFRHQGTATYALGIDDVSVTNGMGPMKPSGLKVVAGAEGALSATMSWTNPSTNGVRDNLSEVQAEIYRDNALIATLADGVTPGGKSEYTDTQVPNGKHTYAVVAKTAEGRSLPLSKTVYVGMDIPAKVGDLTVTVIDGQNHLSWTAPTEGANKGYFKADGLTYKIYRTSGDTGTLIASGVTATSYIDQADPGAAVSYTVAPANAAGEGAGAESGQVVHFAAEYKDINVAPGATAENGNERLPFDLQNSSTATEMMVYPADLYHAVGKMQGLVFKNSFSAYTTLTMNIKVWLGETDSQDLSGGWIPASKLSAVFSGPVTMKSGQNDISIPFTAPYAYTGKNLVVLVLMEAAQGTGGYFDRFFVQAVTGKPNRTRTSTASGETVDTEALQPSSGTLTEALPSMRLVMAADNAGCVEGTVTVAGGQAVAGASVAIPAQQLSATTGADGRFRFYVVRTGEAKLTVSAPKFQTREVTVQVKANETLRADITLDELAKVKVSGRVQLEGVGAVAGVKATLALAGEQTVTTTAADGSFALQAYSGSDNVITFSSPLFDSVEKAFNSTADITGLDITLPRSAIAPHAVQAEMADNGKRVSLTWGKPETRTGKVQWTRWGKSETHDNLGGDYSEQDYCVAHAYTAKDLQDSSLVGMSVTRLRAYLSGNGTRYTAMVWRGTRDAHTVADSVVINVPEGHEGWVTADFPNPVELRADENYMVGIHCMGATDSECVGQGPSYSKIAGKNNLKWSDNSSYTYNGYYAWNLSAYCSIPGSNGEYGEPVAALPAPTYNIYRTEEAAGAADVLLKAGAEGNSYSDPQWDTAHPATYRYKVEAVYAGGKKSAAAVSGAIERKADTDTGVERILSPAKSQNPQHEAEVKVRLRNYGEKPATSVPVVVELSDGQRLEATFSGSLAKGESADLTVGTATLKPETYYTFKAYTRTEGDMVAADDTASAYLPNYTDVNLQGFRWDAYDYVGLIDFHANVPEEAAFVTEVRPNDNLLQAGEYAGGKFYGFTGNSAYAPQQFVALNTTSWSPTFSASTSDLVFDMTYDYTTGTMYSLSVSNDRQSINTVNLATGANDRVAYTDKSFSTLACSPEGKLYAIANDFKLYTVDKATGASAPVGDLGVDDVRPLHSMTFDRRSGRLFWVQNGFNTAGKLFQIDTATGKAQLLGTVRYKGYPTEIVALNIAPGTPTAIRQAAAGNDGKGIQARLDAAGRIHADVALASGQTATVSVHSVAGAAIASATTAQAHTVLATALKPGLYIISVSTSDGRKASVKVRR